MRIGVTERGDPSLSFEWVDKLAKVDAAVIITKNLTDKVIQAAAPYFGKLKFHVSCTGYGGTVVEPNTPAPEKQLEQCEKLVAAGFSKERIVIRIDPIIPTLKGVAKAERVLRMFAEKGFTRFRVSLIDMYPHVRERFERAGLPLPYGNRFSPSDADIARVDEMLKRAKIQHPEIIIECCAEPKITAAAHVGCVSVQDIEDFGLNVSQISDRSGFQRTDCLCCSAKTELLSGKHRCNYGCLYCYWKDTT